MSFCGRRCAIRFAFIFLVSVLSVSAQEMTETDALQRFERENLQVRALAARVREVRAESRSASLAPNPSVTYTREDSAGTQDNFLLVQQQLPVTGRLGLLKRASDSATSAAQADADHSHLLLRSEFRLSFYALLLAQERDAHLAKALIDLEKILKILRDREREGEGSAFDRLRAERELADVRANRASGQALLAHARSRLAAMLAPGTAPASLKVRGDILGGGTLPSVEDLLTRAVVKRGDLVARRNEFERLGYEERAGTACVSRSRFSRRASSERRCPAYARTATPFRLPCPSLFSTAGKLNWNACARPGSAPRQNSPRSNSK